MELIYLVANMIGLFLLGLFIKSYIPSYVNEKGKNLATKKDIKYITRKTEEVKIEFQKEFQNFSSKITFDYEYYYKQYSLLYANLYAIVSQSEYLRYFYNEYESLELSVAKVPFIETSLEEDDKKLNTETSNFDKKLIYECIINNAGLASPELLKLAVAYRFTNNYYSGSDKRLEGLTIKEAFNKEELLLIKAIISRIVSEYNILRKMLKLTYSEKEIQTGILSSEEWTQ